MISTKDLEITKQQIANAVDLRTELSAAYKKALNSTEIGQALIADNSDKFLSPTSQLFNSKLDLKIGVNQEWQREKTFADMQNAQSIWNKLELAKRVEILTRFVQALKSDEVQEYLIFTLMLELGKDTTSAKSELSKTIEYLNYYLSDNFISRLNPQTENKITLERKPRGNVGIITSANYPIALSMPAFIAGLVSGNAIIIKPTTKALLWSCTIKSLFIKAAGVELAGLVQIIIGYDLDFYKQVDALFFVGSEETGKMIRRERFNYRLVHNSIENGTDIFELGGISPAIVLKSHTETTETAKAIFAGITGNSGQRCTATKLVLIEEGVDPLLLKNLESYFINFDKSQLDSPFLANTKFGPIFDKNVISKMLETKELAAKFNLKYIGGELVERAGGGMYITPLLINATHLHDSPLLKFVYQCEIFGPVAFVFENIENLDAVIDRCHLIDQPLSCGIYCTVDELKTFRAQTIFGSVNHNKTAKDLSPYGSHGARFRSGGSSNDASAMINALTYPVSYNS